MFKKTIVITAITAILTLVFSGCGSSVDLNANGFNKIEKIKDGDVEIIKYAGSVSLDKASEIFHDWALNDGWENGSDHVSIGEYSGRMYEKGKDVMLINTTGENDEVIVDVTVIKDGVQLAQSTPPDADTIKFANYDSMFDLSGTYNEIELLINGRTFTYKFAEREEIDGVETQHIKILSDQKSMEIWIDKDEKILKAVSDGESLSVDKAQPGIMFLEYLRVFFSDQSWNPAWDFAESEDASRNLGSGIMKITKYSFQMADDPLSIVNEICRTSDGYLIINYSAFDMQREKVDEWKITGLIEK